MSNNENPLINSDSNNENPLINTERRSEGREPNPSQPPSQPTSQTQRETNIEKIRTREITGPLVILFGPRNVGKTVTLLRLDRYIRASYDVTVDRDFWENRNEHEETVNTFEAIRNNLQFAPDATGTIDFLLLNIDRRGRFCQILEAPGEHFFNKDDPNKNYPYYLNQIFAADYRKVFIFLFELNMFQSDKIFQDYADKIAQLVTQKLSPRKDRIIILCNKCDEHRYYNNGKPIKSEYRNRLYNHSSFKRLKDILSKSNFTHIPFIVFSSGTFTNTGSDTRGEEKTFALSPDDFPKSLWNEIHDSIEEPWFGSLKRLFGG